MNVTYTLLTPVKEDDLRLTFGSYRQVSGNINPDELFAPTISYFKKMAIGNHFWFVADPDKWVVHSCGGMLETMTLIKQHELVKHPPEILFKHTHPADIAQMFVFSKYWVSYFSNLPPEKKAHVQATVYLRVLNAKNIYNWMMIQYVDTIVNDDGKIMYGLTLVTDIAHIKKDGVAMMSILDTSDDSCQQFFCVDGESLSNPKDALPKISKRELEVLRYLAKGYSSKQIADILQISVKTIDNHRQNMLRKTNSKSSGELVAFGISMGYM